MLAGIAFYLFSTILILSAILVVTVRNPVHSVLFLILSFFNASGLFVLLGAEFVAMILVIVYVGAVAVLFLFVVMMLDISFADVRKGAMQFVPLGLAIGALLLFELVIAYGAWSAENVALAGNIQVDDLTNTEALGQLIYTKYVFAFQGAGLVLFVAMIGAIVLTHRSRPGVRKQKVAEQQARTIDESMEVRKVTPGTGV